MKPCIEPLCPELIKTGTRCEEHTKQRRRETRGRTLGAKMYQSKRWKALRRKVLRRDRYTCQACKRFGNEVDHVLPIVQGGAEWGVSNLQTLCKSCHSRKTATELWS